MTTEDRFPSSDVLPTLPRVRHSGDSANLAFYTPDTPGAHPTIEQMLVEVCRTDHTYKRSANGTYTTQRDAEPRASASRCGCGSRGSPATGKHCASPTSPRAGRHLDRCRLVR